MSDGTREALTHTEAEILAHEHDGTQDGTTCLMCGHPLSIHDPDPEDHQCWLCNAQAQVERYKAEAEQLQATLTAVEEQVALVYAHITNNQISKCNTPAERVIAVADDIATADSKEQIEEFRQQAQPLEKEIAELLTVSGNVDRMVCSAAENATGHRGFHSPDEAVAALVEHISTLSTERDRLAAALECYGDHATDCRIIAGKRENVRTDETTRCTCGFDALDLDAILAAHDARMKALGAAEEVKRMIREVGLYAGMAISKIDLEIRAAELRKEAERG